MARNLDILFPGVTSHNDSFIEWYITTNARKFYKDWKANPGDYFRLRFVHHRYGKVRRRATKHVSQDDDTLTGVDTLRSTQNLEPARLHIITWADGDCFECCLFSDDMLERIAKLLRKPAMRDDDKSDHVRRAISLQIGDADYSFAVNLVRKVASVFQLCKQFFGLGSSLLAN